MTDIQKAFREAGNEYAERLTEKQRLKESRDGGHAERSAAFEEFFNTNITKPIDLGK